VNRYVPASERLSSNHQLIERANGRAKHGKVFIEAEDGQRLKVKTFGGVLLDFPRAYHAFGHVEISWTLLQRVADGKTTTIHV
jgi:hypothetical protein